MLFNVYSIFDNKMVEFLPPFVAKNDEVACRMVKQSQANFKLDVSDFSLYQIGVFDNENVEKSNHLTSEYKKIVDLSILFADVSEGEQ